MKSLLCSLSLLLFQEGFAQVAGSKAPTYFEPRPVSSLSIGATTIPNASQFYVTGVSYDWTGVHFLDAYASGPGEAAGLVVSLKGSNYTGAFSAAMQIRPEIVNTGGDTSAIQGGSAAYGIDVLAWADNNGVQKKGATVAVQGYATGDNSVNNGVSGISFPTRSNSTNVATAGFAIKSQFLTGLQSVGLLGQIGSTVDSGIPPLVEEATCLLDNRTTGAPLIIGRTNNGAKVFRVDSDGTVSTPAVKFGQGPRITINVSNPSAGQVLKIHSVTGSSVVLTNGEQEAPK